MNRLQSQARLKTVLRNYFNDLNAPLAWCTSAGPTEILRALGFKVYFPENHGALIGATRTAGKYIPRAHQEGYHAEICSYLTADIGSYLMGETPLKQAYGLDSVPKPDLIVFNTNQCREVSEWFSFFGREFDCPVVGVFPPRHLDEITSADIDQVVSQFEKLICTGEEIIGHRLDSSMLEKTVRLSKQGTSLWKKLLETARQSPSPLTFWDGVIIMAPVVLLRGTQVCVDFYKEALDELLQLNEAGRGAVPDEEIRIFWEGMPIWGRLRALSELFAEKKAAVVASTYCNSWIFDDFDPADPLRSMALAYTQIFINRGEETKLKILKQMLTEYKIDGIIFHDSKTCFNNTNCRFGLHERLHSITGIPTATLDGDLNDLRFFSDGQAWTRLETFMEQLKRRNQPV